MAKLSVLGRFAAGIEKVSGYLLAIATTCTATGVRYAMQQELADRNRMMLFIPAVLLTAWYGGVGPGIFAAVLGAFLCAWILIPPANVVNFGDSTEQVGMVLYLFISAAVILLVHRERSEKRIRERAQEELKQVNSSLEERVRERTRELEGANRELEGFCYSVSHDLRTPTRAIVGNAHILMDDYGDEVTPPVREKLGRISRAAMKLSDLVDALLTYARLAKADLTKEPVNLCNVVALEAQARGEAAGVRVELERPAEVTLVVDKAQLRTAVEAIVGNAVLYRKKGEPVRLSVDCSRIGSDVVVSFRDRGIGFDTQYLDKVFQPFERLHRDEDYAGVGMGLANVARIMSRHRGKVWAESTPGQGSVFYLQFGDQERAIVSPNKAAFGEGQESHPETQSVEALKR